MDPLGYQSSMRTTLPPLPAGSPYADGRSPTANTGKWPSSPVVKPDAVGGNEVHDSSVVWPHRAVSPTPSSLMQGSQSSRQSSYPQNGAFGQSQSAARGSMQVGVTGAGRPQNGTLQPRSPVRQDDRRVTGSLDGVGSSKGKAPAPGVTRLRVSAVERNRRDLFIKFDAFAITKTERSGHFPNVSRSYREFGLLFEALAANNPHTIVPPVPFPNTSAPGQADDERLVAASFQQFFDRILDDPALRTDDELCHFLESDFGYTPATRARRKINSGAFGFSLSRSTSRVGLSDEEDELANARLQFRLLDEKLTDATHSIEAASKARRQMAIAHAEASEKVAAFSTTEDHPPLSEGLRRLARSERAFGDIEANAAIGEMVTLSDGMGWCAVQARAGKDVLKNRVSVLEDHHAAAKKSIERRRNIERIQASSNINADKVDGALEELEEAKKVEEVLARKAMAIGTNLRPALRAHSKHLHDDLLYALMEHARTQTIYERQILKELELLRPEIARIPSKDSGLVYVAQPSSAPTSPVPSPALSMRRGGSNAAPYSPRPSSVDSVTSSYGRPQSVYGASPNLSAAGAEDPLSSSMINTSSGSTLGRSHRINDMARSVLVTKGEMDRRQAVDAKSAAASLARLF